MSSPSSRDAPRDYMAPEEQFILPVEVSAQMKPPTDWRTWRPESAAQWLLVVALIMTLLLLGVTGLVWIVTSLGSALFVFPVNTAKRLNRTGYS